ncbi:signal peptidase I [Candidatus Woesearchaeota archaeon]|nr:MAG: signal peptidase I [Candidatus Woesearchaeota archaeon]
MKYLYAILVIATFTLGLGIGALAGMPKDSVDLSTSTATSRALSFSPAKLSSTQKSEAIKPTQKELTLEGPVERDSPADWIEESQIEMRPDGVFIRVNNPQWAILADTNSMDPVFDAGSHLIQILPTRPEQIHVGDIVSYQSPAGYSIVHRVIEIGEDEEGWYAILKGDNNPQPDPWKVRFEWVRRVTVMVVY